MYEDGTPGEIHITMSKEGSTISGLMDTIATSVSLSLQYGVPLKVLVDRFSYMRFEPSGFTGNPAIPIAKSIVDYIFRWLGLKFLTPEPEPQSAIEELPPKVEEPVEEPARMSPAQTDTQSCHVCGCGMVHNGSCYACSNCGATSGC
jgi:ribonucleoside-diphosphate reductase alpha chain